MEEFSIQEKPGLRFSEIETVSESGGLPLKFVKSRCPIRKMFFALL